MTKSTREIGDEFEDEIFKPLGIKKTPNSGAMFNDADGTAEGCIFELKVKSDKNDFSAPAKELKKLRSQAAKRWKDWIYIQRNKSGDQVLMDLELFIKLWQKR